MKTKDLQLLRLLYTPKDVYKPSESFKENNPDSSNMIYITDDELLRKINSKDFSLHPHFPILINENGTEIFDIRDNFKLLIKSNSNPKKRKRCRILNYGTQFVHKLVVESWTKKIVADDESVHHLDGNKNNNHYTNLKILGKEAHKKIHGIEANVKYRLSSKSNNTNKEELKDVQFNLDNFNFNNSRNLSFLPQMKSFNDFKNLEDLIK